MLVILDDSDLSWTISILEHDSHIVCSKIESMISNFKGKLLSTSVMYKSTPVELLKLSLKVQLFKVREELSDSESY